jgi:multidrug efflux pump subunit AcrB
LIKLQSPGQDPCGSKEQSGTGPLRKSQSYDVDRKDALRAPYTFTVLGILLLIGGALSALEMAKDIFPAINIPVVGIIWTYNGLPAQEMAERITTLCERASTTTVNNIEHIESNSFNGIAVVKIYLHPAASIDAAIAEVTASCQTILKAMPAGTTAPNILSYNAANVPILQLSVGGAKFSEQELYDFATNFIRTQLATVQGSSIPLPYGGKTRAVSVDLDPSKLQAYNIAPQEVANAINQQSVVLPSGTAKIGKREYDVLINGSTDTIQALNNLPIKQVNRATVYIRDVANVRDGYTPQVNLVLSNGVKAALLPVLKNGAASTLDVVERVKNALPRIAATLPKELEIKSLFDQSVFVSSALDGVIREGIIAASLTAVMILLFLGSWRSTLVVATSIPLSICFSVLAMHVLGQTINIMTLGGLALAVGILVDDATVEIENIHRNLAMGKSMIGAILDGAQEIATPALVATLCICIVFVPIFLLGGVAYYLFSPLAMAVVFAMLASYFLSRTVVPTMVNFLLQNEHHQPDSARRNWFVRLHEGFNQGFERLRNFYVARLEWALKHGCLVIGAMLAVVVVSLLFLTPFLGEDFFPLVDAGQFRLHVRAPAGTSIEETQHVFSQVDQVIRSVIPKGEIDLVLENIGLPMNLNLALSDTATISSADGEVLVSLNKQKHGSTWAYVKTIREQLQTKFPDYTFFVQPSDIVGQTLNAGLPAPIDVQVVGHDKDNYQIAEELRQRIAQVPGAVDVNIHQVIGNPSLLVNVDRTRADQLGLTEKQVADDLLISLAGSGQTAPNLWLNPQNGVSYSIVVQTPQHLINSTSDINLTPITGASGPQSAAGNQAYQIPSTGLTGSNGAQAELLSNLASIQHIATPVVVSHYNVQPVLDIYANTQNKDLGAVARQVQKIVNAVKPHLPRGTALVVRGQVQSMNTSYLGLGVGIAFAVLLVYFLMVVNFQSWLDPFIIITALPGALTGIVWMLFLTRTTISVPALMGAIMCIGVATSNSILVVTFANEQLRTGKDPFASAHSAGFTRLRPVIMTALAMILGMLPMSLGLGDGGEQNAPLGRAVIGGLLVATFFTLFFVPVAYRILKRNYLTHELHPRLRSHSSDENYVEASPHPSAQR